jgi:molybdopterin-containing oxidoreductase family iron-sulfur binding subunit
MARWGMVIDLDRCTGCQACAVACRVENNVPPIGEDVAARGRSISWMRLARVELRETGEHDGELQLIPLPCMHCDNPPCVKVCPATATTIDEEGLVAQVYSRCIGCRYCTTACPYTVRYFNWKEFEWPEPMEQGLSPDVSIRPRGVVEKCSFCNHRLQLARDRAAFEERELEEGEYVPACVESCPAEAMAFGDLEDPRSEVALLAESPRAFGLMEELGTRPKVLYLSRGE